VGSEQGAGAASRSLVFSEETTMSDKDRQKKDGENKDKKNQRMREAVSARAQKNPTERQRQKHEAKLTDTVPEGEARMKKKATGAGK
jgi:hypothetical protein